MKRINWLQFICTLIFIIGKLSVSFSQEIMDVVYLKSGGKIVCKILEENDAQILVRLQSNGNPEMVIDRINIRELNQNTPDSLITTLKIEQRQNESDLLKNDNRINSNGFYIGAAGLYGLIGGEIDGIGIVNPNFSYNVQLKSRTGYGFILGYKWGNGMGNVELMYSNLNININYPDKSDVINLALYGVKIKFRSDPMYSISDFKSRFKTFFSFSWILTSSFHIYENDVEYLYPAQQEQVLFCPDETLFMDCVVLEYGVDIFLTKYFTLSPSIQYCFNGYFPSDYSEGVGGGLYDGSITNPNIIHSSRFAFSIYGIIYF